MTQTSCLRHRCQVQATSSAQGLFAAAPAGGLAAGLHSWAHCGAQRQPTAHSAVHEAPCGGQPCARGISTSTGAAPVGAVLRA